MATNLPRFDNVEVVKKTKVETTFEYVPILGEILGYWRRTYVNRLGSKIEVHLKHSLEEYDELFVNGQEINVHSKTEEIS